MRYFTAQSNVQKLKGQELLLQSHYTERTTQVLKAWQGP